MSQRKGLPGLQLQTAITFVSKAKFEYKNSRHEWNLEILSNAEKRGAGPVNVKQAHSTRTSVSRTPPRATAPSKHSSAHCPHFHWIPALLHFLRCQPPPSETSQACQEKAGRQCPLARGFRRRCWFDPHRVAATRSPTHRQHRPRRCRRARRYREQQCLQHWWPRQQSTRRR